MLLAPLEISMMHIFPTIYPIAAKTIKNLGEWHKMWQEEPGYHAEAAPQQAERMKKLNEQLAVFRPAKSANHPKKLRHSTTFPCESAGKANLQGSWTCIGTFGLEDFLKHQKVGWAKRKAALGAPWPSWEFQQSGDNIVFINTTAMGVLREEITANRQPFTTVDGWKQTVHCIAYWSNNQLVVEKDGPQGKFRETRHIDEAGKLQFSLEPLDPKGPTWGRSFEPSNSKKK